MKLAVIALDYDGTIAVDGIFDPAVRDAIGTARRKGIAVVLVTGRRLDDLRRVAGDVSCFDAVVGENGAVLDFPASGRHLSPDIRPHLRSSRAEQARHPPRRRRSGDRNRRRQRRGDARCGPATAAAADPGVQSRPPDGAAAGRGEVNRAAACAPGAPPFDSQHHRHWRCRKRS